MLAACSGGTDGAVEEVFDPAAAVAASDNAAATDVVAGLSAEDSTARTPSPASLRPVTAPASPTNSGR